MQKGQVVKALNLRPWIWHRPLIPALGGQRQVDLCESEASLIYIERSSQGYIVRPCVKIIPLWGNRQRTEESWSNTVGNQSTSLSSVSLQPSQLR